MSDSAANAVMEAPERKKIAFSKAQIEAMKSSICDLEAVDEITSYSEVIEKLRPTIGKMRRKGVKLEQIHQLLREKFGVDCTLRTFKNCLASVSKERRGRKPKEAQEGAAPQETAQMPNEQAAGVSVAAAKPDQPPVQKQAQAPMGQQEQSGSDPGGFDLNQWDFSGVKG